MNHWILSYRNFNPEEIRHRETLLTLGNGYMATRGAMEFCASDKHYAGTYLAGVFNQLESTVAHKRITNEDMVNIPNWLSLMFQMGDEDWFDVTQVHILHFREQLHLKKGLLKRTCRFEDRKGRRFIVNSIRCISQAHPHLSGLRCTVFSENWSGTIKIRTSLSAAVSNSGVLRYQGLSNHHLEVVSKGITPKQEIYLHIRTIDSRVDIAQTIKTSVYTDEDHKILAPHSFADDTAIHQEWSINIVPYQRVHIAKICAVVHGKDRAIYEPLQESMAQINNAPPLHKLIGEHLVAWKKLWDQTDIQLQTNGDEQKLIRLHIFHTLQSISPHSAQLDYGAPARGLHGEAYRGHVFWDELFILPFYIYHDPETAKNLLMYRYHRLPAARELAQKYGYQGAMFPWQSASNGEETTQQWHLNPQSGQWGPDLSHNQRHVNMAIAYSIWRYYLITQDVSFMRSYGAEIFFDIAKFISSISQYNSLKNKFEIHGVMGPDEYHERGLDGEEGLPNNAYTNLMAVWVLSKALLLIKSHYSFAQLASKMHITAAEQQRWQKICKHMFIPIHEGVISQFEGYHLLEEFPWDDYEKSYAQLERLDRILKAEGKEPSHFQIAKQPDALMIYYLLDEDEVTAMLTHLGLKTGPELKPRSIDYYLKRTSHGSTLSKIVFASLLYPSNRAAADKLYHAALCSDFADTQGGTTQEGIHLGVMVGTMSFLWHTVSGITFKKDQLHLKPQLPSWITRLKFRFFARTNLYEIEIDSHQCSLLLLEQHRPLPILLFDQLIQPTLNKKITIEFNSATDKDFSPKNYIKAQNDNRPYLKH